MPAKTGSIDAQGNSWCYKMLKQMDQISKTKISNNDSKEQNQFENRINQTKIINKQLREYTAETEKIEREESKIKNQDRNKLFLAQKI